MKDLDDENVDLALIGEGELSVVQLVNALINKEDISKIPGLVKKIGNEKKGSYLGHASAQTIEFGKK